MNKKSKFKVLCRSCQQHTNHCVLHKASKEIDFGIQESDEFIHWDFITLQCLGCDNVCLLINRWQSGDYNPETKKVETTQFIHPSPYKDEREPMKDIQLIPNSIKTIYLETIHAYNYKLAILCAIGIRSIIEAVCKERKIKEKNLKSKINKLAEERIITPDGAALLHWARDNGNFAAHELKRHTEDKLRLCLDIEESLLQDLYVFPSLKESFVI